MRMIFVNLPVKDVKASRRFYEALGFGINEQFCSDDTACLVVEENIFVMLLEEARFRTFIERDIADTAKTVEVLNCLSAESREAVHELKRKALAAGGKDWKPDQDYGFMLNCSFQDLDGHVWEVAYMDMAAAAEQMGQPAEATA